MTKKESGFYIEENISGKQMGTARLALLLFSRNWHGDVRTEWNKIKRTFF